MKKYTAACSCGQLKIHFEAELQSSTICHCFACQKRTGSVFSVQVKCEKSRATIEGQSTTWVRRTKNDVDIAFQFCPTCGSTVFFELGDVPGYYAIAAGCLTNPDLPAPKLSVYTSRKHKWLELPASVTTVWETD